MSRRIWCSLTFALVLISVPIFADQAAEEQKLQDLAQEYVKLSFSFDPVYASEMGDNSPEYMRYPDYSKRSINKFESSLKGLLRDLRKVKQSDLSVDGKIDYQLLESDVSTELIYLGHSKLVRDNPKAMSSSAINGVYYILISTPNPDSAELDLILKRLEDLPRFLGSAKSILSRPPRLWSALAEDEANQGVEMLTDLASYFTQRVPSRAAEIEQRFNDATTALGSFVELMDAMQLVRDSDVSFGKQNYNELLHVQHFLDFDADSLLRLGQYLFDNAVAQYDSVRAIIDTLPPLEEQTYFVPKSFSSSDVLDYFQWEINQSRDWVVESGYATVPPDIGDCEPVETPAFLRNIIGGVAYQPAGPFAAKKRGLFYVNPLPDTLDETSRSAYFRYCMQRGFRSSTVHEAYPGHHLQLQMASRNPSLIRRLQQNNLMVEGWALYCEQAVYEDGFYGNDPRAYLRVLGGVLFRAARIIVDVKLHTGQFTYQDAVGWMTENLNAPIDFVETEVSRYTLTPTQPMSYLLGKLEIQDIRDLYRSQHPDDFDLQTFHDMLLSQGSIPPRLVYLKLSGGIK